MARWLKTSISAADKADADTKVRATVEGLLGDIAKRGDAAVREMSVKFDKWDRADYRLTDAEIQACLDQLTGQDLEDIRFAQAQVRNFAQHQRAALQDIEVETLPGVVLGHKNLPVNSVGCYVPGGKYPLLASAHMSVVTAKVAGVPRIVTCAPPSKASRRRRSSRRSTWPAPTRSTASAACRPWAPWRWGPRASPPVDMLVGPGNAYVAEAKRQLYRPRRHRPLRRPDRDAGHRRRDGGCRALRHRPAGPGGARPDHAGDPADDVREAGARDDGGGRAAARHPADRRRRPAGLGRLRRGDRLRQPGGDGGARPTASPPSMCR